MDKLHHNDSFFLWLLWLFLFVCLFCLFFGLFFFFCLRVSLRILVRWFYSCSQNDCQTFSSHNRIQKGRLLFCFYLPLLLVRIIVFFRIPLPDFPSCLQNQNTITFILISALAWKLKYYHRLSWTKLATGMYTVKYMTFSLVYGYPITEQNWGSVNNKKKERNGCQVYLI